MALKEQTKAAEKNIFNQTFKSNQTNQKGEIMRQLTQRVRAFSTLGRHRQWQAGTRAGRVRGNTGKNERQAYTQADGETSMEAGRVRGNTGRNERQAYTQADRETSMEAGRVRGNTGKNERQAGRRRNKHGGRLRGVARMYTDRGVWQECTQVEGCGKNVHRQRDVASM